MKEDKEDKLPTKQELEKFIKAVSPGFAWIQKCFAIIIILCFISFYLGMMYVEKSVDDSQEEFLDILHKEGLIKNINYK